MCLRYVCDLTTYHVFGLELGLHLILGQLLQSLQFEIPAFRYVLCVLAHFFVWLKHVYASGDNVQKGLGSVS